ncbi:MAG: sugar phosphate nucleotidyltransferase [Candidatus Pelethousia sp.]|nr:sugar phosphate nucleotidyltransferase [Candidatus Pelethousia sp.]
MQAVIMAGGEGKRLRPLTCTMPKPMVPLLNKPVIDYCVELLTAHGIADIAATLHYLPNMISQHLGDGRAFGANIRYSVEDKPLGTAGSVRAAVGDAASGPVLVLSGDAMTDIDLSALAERHAKSGAAATIVLKRVQVPTEYGVAILDETNRITRFLEKPQLSEVFSDLANTGIYLLSPEAVEMIPQDTKYDFSMDLFPKMLKADMRIEGYITESYWCDIGDLEQYLGAQRDMLLGKCAFETLAVEREGIWIEHGARISSDAAVIAPCYIGRDAEVAAGAVLADGAVLCSGSRVGTGSSIKRSVLMPGARVRENVEIRGAILCEGAHVDSGAQVFAHTALGAGSSVGKNCAITAGASLWPNKRLEDDARCAEDVVWDDGLQKSGLDTCVKGFADHDLGPERAARVGAALAIARKAAGKELAIATDGSQQAVMLKHALLSGILAQGADVCDLGYCAYSAFEHAVFSFGMEGGAYVRHGGQSPHETELVLCDDMGCQLTGGAFRAFRQELLMGPHHPVTAQRLGILQPLGGAARAYEAHLAKSIATARVPETNDVKLVLGRGGDIYDAVARVLLPAGYTVQYMDEKDPERLHGAMVHAGAELGFVAAAGGEGEMTCIWRDRYLREGERITIFILCALVEGRLRGEAVLPVRVSEEYAAFLEGRGCRIRRCPDHRAKWRRQALEEGCYLPELFEPEAAILRLAELCRAEKLGRYLDEIPQAYESEASVGCSWKEMGRVLRSLVETEPNSRVELIDGVKVKSDNGWILVRPNRDFTACRIIAGSYNAEYAKELTDLYLDKVRQLAKDKNGKP